MRAAGLPDVERRADRPGGERVVHHVLPANREAGQQGAPEAELREAKDDTVNQRLPWGASNNQ